MKYVMTSHDIMAITAELKNLGEMRVNNVYDVDSRYICLKIRTHDKKVKFIKYHNCKEINYY